MAVKVLLLDMRVLSGVKPSGDLHIGNYLGAIRQWVKTQETEENFFMIVNLHSMSSPYNPLELKQRTIEIATHYLALGLNPKKSLIFVQSHIPEHPMLMWFLNTLIPYSELTRMTQFKDALARKKSINADIFNYPVLMAADILLYKANAVPVGEDQLQHLELARTIARKFNRTFGKIFPEPKPILSELGAVRIMSLSEPTKKMSKSAGEAIYLTDSASMISLKIRRAVTDSGNKILKSKDKPGISNLLTIYSLFTERPIKSLEQQYNGRSYAEFKNDLAQVIINHLKPCQEKFKKLQKNPSYVKRVLADSAKKAQKIAQKTLKEVKRKMGLL